MVKKYIKKPIVIEAIQWDGSTKRKLEIVDFMKSGQYQESFFNPGELIIPTLEGDLTVSVGDFIIKGIKGEFYPCKPDIFEATYEEVPPTQKDKEE